MVSLPRRGAIGPFLKMPIYWHFCQLVGCRVTIRRKRPRASKSRTRRKCNGRLIVFAPPRYPKNIKLFFPARKKCLFGSSVTCIVVRMPNGYVCACQRHSSASYKVFKALVYSDFVRTLQLDGFSPKCCA